VLIGGFTKRRFFLPGSKHVPLMRGVQTQKSRAYTARLFL
jgi:hypothetical protein